MTVPSSHPSLRVLISGHLPPPMGGLAAFCQTLINSSLPTRVDLEFVITSSQSRQLADSGKVSASNLVSAMRDCLRFTTVAIRHHPHVVHISTTFGLSFVKHAICVLIARMLGSRVLLHPHCSPLVLYTERSSLWKSFFKAIVALTDGVIALSQEWIRTGNILRLPTYCMPNAIAIADYGRSADQTRSQTEPGSELNALYLGYLGRAKGSFDLIEAATDLRDLKLKIHLVGGELSLGELDLLRVRLRSSAAAGIVEIHPPVIGLEKLNLLRKADIFLYPSHHEGLPIAVIEAMASGLAIIATRVGGLPDLVHEGVNGLLVPPGEPMMLSSAVRKLWSNRALLRAMQCESFRLAVEEYDIEKRIPRLIEIYRATMGVPCGRQ
jgi:glycosyltransferase involved in cell wall biosynthesis